MKSFVVIAFLTIHLSIVYADVSHINSFNAPIRHAYIYTKNPQQGFIPGQFSQQQQQLQLPRLLPQQQQPQQQQLLHNRNYNQIQQPATYLNNVQFPMPQQYNLVDNAKIGGVKSVRRSKPRVKIAKKPIITKNFYVHTAPEETDEELRDELKKLEEQPRKHFNVLFVKTPTQTSKFAAINLAKAIKGEQKTVVYVLSKKTTASDLRDAINVDAPQEINKPDVFFIKYRTPEEAAHAQQQIQSQYDKLEGPSTITDEGEGPIASVVGSLDASTENDEESEEEEEQQQPEQINDQIENFTTRSTHNDKTNSIYFGQPYLPPSNRL